MCNRRSALGLLTAVLFSMLAWTSDAVTQTAGKVLLDRRPDCVVVVGDVNSTVAAALVAAKLGIRLAHVEAGLRSGDRSMPEEINRLVTDVLADVLFTTSDDAHDHLSREGIDPAKVHFVGNVMVDSALAHLPAARNRSTLTDLGVQPPFALVTLHRPSNVDDPTTFAALVGALDHVARQMPLVFPVHPRTAQRVRDLKGVTGDWRFLEPLGYLDFLNLTSQARLVLTDSGGLQEETTVLGVPCLTLRENTERPVTITHGTNRLVGVHPDAIVTAIDEALAMPLTSSKRPPLWDGKAAERIVDVLLASS